MSNMTITFERSEQIAMDTGLPMETVSIASEDFVQITYDGLRTGPNGDFIAYVLDGIWYYQDVPFSDIIIQADN